MESPLVLEKAERAVQLNERTFIVREMSGAEASSLSKISLTLLNGLAEEAARPNAKPVDSLLHSMEALSQSECEIALRILREPLDGGAPADLDFVKTLSHRQISALSKLQEEFNDTAALIKNVQGLLASIGKQSQD